MLSGSERRSNRRFCNKKPTALRYSQIGLIRRARRPRESATQWSPRSLGINSPRRHQAKAELASMLPGFRFLFTAIVLSMSILVFGLGAAALLRAAHEEFANLPSRRAPPEPMFARLNDDPPPTLALLRVDPPVAEKPPDDVAAAAVPPMIRGTGRANPGRPSGRARETGGADSRQSRCRPKRQSRKPRRRKPARRHRRRPGRNRGARCRCGSEDRRHRGNAGACRCQRRLQLRRSRQRISRRSKAMSPRP